ncbi:hypothetical protein OPV22_017845 [Ensete ventricosum]|uniref:CASP-like protein n=1 Tax=Ensete ventricosum TaxID=4639 RepID=A0AAV8QUL4_ENSVE|nr:hypothetical protein OPV22_017845 [Ensete ventricosum]
MATKITDAEAQQQQKQPLLAPDSSGDDQVTPVQRAISQTFRSTAHLAKLLPTGTVLAFQLLAPIFTDGGHCVAANRLMTVCLVALCALSCFVFSFTDSFRDGDGTVRYGLATFKGLWVIDGITPLAPTIAVGYRIKFIDFVHAFMSIMIFAAVALFDQNVASCVGQMAQVQPIMGFSEAHSPEPYLY